jgi:hypothetical protein
VSSRPDWRGWSDVTKPRGSPLKYEQLYRHDITDGQALADHVDDYLDTYNGIRPHEAIDWQRPIDRYQSIPRNDPDPQTLRPEI